MMTTFVLRLEPFQAAQSHLYPQFLKDQFGYKLAKGAYIKVLKQSIDARKRTIYYNITIGIYDQNTPPPTLWSPIIGKHLHASNPVVIVGAGPAGLFAAIELIEQGVKPIVIERGKDVRSRRHDLAALNKHGIVNPESNYCFGEGGAGTYSDGKLYTRSHKRGNIQKALEIFHYFGADERILTEAHPHIGTNKLPKIIMAMRDFIIEAGGEVHFNTKLVDIKTKADKVVGIQTNHGVVPTTTVILATGHSARDIFELLAHKQWLIEAKPFALGVRIEHPQQMIDCIQYHGSGSYTNYERSQYLPAASYSLVTQAHDRGVFSFCMCPGGIIAPAATTPGELVVNGWSPSKRNNPYANSGMVVAVSEQDFAAHGFEGSLAGMWFQQQIEKRCFELGGGALKAPAQRVQDFIQGKVSQTLPDCSYHPGISSVSLNEAFPKIITDALRQGLKVFGEKLKGYASNEGVLVACESRTSSPVRILEIKPHGCIHK